MSTLDRYGFIREQLKRDKLAGRSNNVLGDVFHVLPGSSATHLNYAKKQRRNVFDTIDAAYAQMVSGRGDAMVIWPGSHTPTASIAVAKNNISVFGWEAWLQQKVRKSASIITAPAGAAAFAITGENAKLIGLACVPVTQQSFATFTGDADGLTIRDCFLDLFTPAVHLSTKGFTASAGIDNFLFEGNVIWSDGAQGPGLTLSGLNNNALCRGNLWHVDAGTWAVAASLIDIDGLLVEEDTATCGGTAMTACYDGSGTTVVAGAVFKRCVNGVNVTKFVDGFGTTSHAELVQNYIGTIGGGNGGATLVTAIT